MRPASERRRDRSISMCNKYLNALSKLRERIAHLGEILNRPIDILDDVDYRLFEEENSEEEEGEDYEDDDEDDDYDEDEDEEDEQEQKETMDDRCHGGLLNGMAHGYGLQCSDGISYPGKWNPCPHGEIKRYDGEWIDGEMSGKGKLLTNGGSYMGQFLHNRLHGLGLFVEIKKEYFYLGEWKDGICIGQGMRWNGGETSAIYDGYLFKGRPSGRGSVTYDTGDCYEGDFNDGEKHGFGSYLYVDGSRYCGEFKKSHQEGRGVLEIPRQQITYDCEFKHDEPVYGEYSSPEFHYEGNFSQFRFNGFGCLLVKSTGMQYRGMFSMDMLEGIVKVSWPNGDRWRGEFANDAPKQGVMTFAHNKATLNGAWIDNELKNGAGLVTMSTSLGDLQGRWVERKFYPYDLPKHPR